MVQVFEDIISNIKANGNISESDVLALRQLVFKDGLVNTHEAAQLIALNEISNDDNNIWQSYYLEVIGDFAFENLDGARNINETKAAFLVAETVKNGRISHFNNFVLLGYLINKANSYPPELSNVLKTEIETAISTNNGVTRNNDFEINSAITDLEIEVLGDIMHSIGSNSGTVINQTEAEYLFNLKDIIKNKKISEKFKDFFAKAIGNYLMAHNFDADNSWKRKDLGNFFDIVAKLFTKKSGDEWLEDHSESSIKEEEKITSNERLWLDAQIERDNQIDDYEKAVLEFIAK